MLLSPESLKSNQHVNNELWNVIENLHGKKLREHLGVLFMQIHG